MNDKIEKKKIKKKKLKLTWVYRNQYMNEFLKIHHSNESNIIFFYHLACANIKPNL
jgi:hypothetical protein